MSIHGAEVHESERMEAEDKVEAEAEGLPLTGSDQKHDISHQPMKNLDQILWSKDCWNLAIL